MSSQSGDPPVIAKGRHESIVSEDEFSLAGRAMASKAPQVTHPKQTASVYMLSRMLQCRHCGESLTVRPSKRQSSRYYQCRTRRLDGVEVCGCPNLNVQKLDERVLRVVLDDILCPSNVQVAIAKMSEELTKPYEEKHAILQAIESELADLSGRQSRVMEAYEAKAYTVDDYKRRIAPLRATEAGLKVKRAEVAGELDHQTAVLARPEEVLQFASELSDFLENSSPKDRKQMLNRFIKCIWIEPGKGTVVYRIPLPKDANRPHATELVLALDGPVPPTVRLTPLRRAIGHTFEFTFSLPKPANRGGHPHNWNKPAVKTSRKATPMARKPKPRVEPTPEQIEAQKEARRAYEKKRNQTPERKELKRRVTQEKRNEARSLGLCITCHGTPIPDQTRCETCAENHRVSRRQSQQRAINERD